MVDARLSGNKRGKSVVTVPFLSMVQVSGKEMLRSAFSFCLVVTVSFLTASLLGKLFSDMVRVVDCHAGVLGSNPGGPKDFPLGITSVY